MSYNITRKQAIERAPLLKAWGEGKKLQYNNGYGWHDCAEMHGILDDPKVEYRIKPEPKLRPWKPEEVPYGVIIREKRFSLFDPCGEMIIRRDSYGAAVLGDGSGGFKWVCPQELFRSYQHSTDHGKTWLPCGILE